MHVFSFLEVGICWCNVKIYFQQKNKNTAFDLHKVPIRDYVSLMLLPSYDKTYQIFNYKSI